MRMAAVKVDDGDTGAHRAIPASASGSAVCAGRYNLHKRAYQHRVARVIELMQCEALLLANDHFLLAGKDGAPTRMSEAIDDMVAYTGLTDHVLHSIQYSVDPRLAPARALLNAIDQRQIYPFVGQHLMAAGDYVEKAEFITNEILAAAAGGEDPSNQRERPLESSDIIVEVVEINYGMQGRNPVDQVRFYRPGKDGVHAFAVPSEQVSCLLPTVFKEQYVRVYVKFSASKPAAKAAFDSWVVQQLAKEPVQTPAKRPRT
jgi:hypothetical protein